MAISDERAGEIIAEAASRQRTRAEWESRIARAFQRGVEACHLWPQELPKCLPLDAWYEEGIPATQAGQRAMLFAVWPHV